MTEEKLERHSIEYQYSLHSLNDWLKAWKIQNCILYQSFLSLQTRILFTEILEAISSTFLYFRGICNKEFQLVILFQGGLFYQRASFPQGFFTRSHTNSSFLLKFLFALKCPICLIFLYFLGQNISIESIESNKYFLD